MSNYTEVELTETFLILFLRVGAIVQRVYTVSNQHQYVNIIIDFRTVEYETLCKVLQHLHCEGYNDVCSIVTTVSRHGGVEYALTLTTTHPDLTPVINTIDKFIRQL